MKKSSKTFPAKGQKNFRLENGLATAYMATAYIC